jgi:acetate kinase
LIQINDHHRKDIIMNDTILIVNAGSSSIKCSLFTHQALKPDSLTSVYHADVTGIGSQVTLKVKTTTGKLIEQKLGEIDHEHAFTILIDWIDQCEPGFNLIAAGHRVVHGGMIFTAPIRITPTILLQLEQLIPLAPLHQPHNLAPIKILTEQKANLLQVACFDTAFHATQSTVASTFALPRQLINKGIKAYGFHGLSYEYIAQQLPKVNHGKLPIRVIVAHLGNGASMAALKDGRSIATTMGFTALDGLPMGTRCGTIDPGVLLHLLAEGMTVAELNDLLYHHSGLLGVSGISNDMQKLLQSDSPHAKEAIQLFTYRAVRTIGSLSAALEGLDALVFTAGIGERATSIRAKICEQLTWLGIELNTKANEQHQTCISTDNSRVSVWVIPTDEEKMIAQHTLTWLKTS